MASSRIEMVRKFLAQADELAEEADRVCGKQARLITRALPTAIPVASIVDNEFIALLMDQWSAVVCGLLVPNDVRPEGPGPEQIQQACASARVRQALASALSWA